jgi:hypothetical protein
VKTSSVTPSEDSAAPEPVARLVRDLLETWNAHALGRLETFYAPDYEGADVGQAGPQRGPQSVSQNIPPTGRRIAVCGISLLTIEGGRISRGLYVWDVAGLLRSIGLLPEL